MLKNLFKKINVENLVEELDKVADETLVELEGAIEKIRNYRKYKGSHEDFIKNLNNFLSTNCHFVWSWYEFHVFGLTNDLTEQLSNKFDHFGYHKFRLSNLIEIDGYNSVPKLLYSPINDGIKKEDKDFLIHTLQFLKSLGVPKERIFVDKYYKDNIAHWHEDINRAEKNIFVNNSIFNSIYN